MLKPFRRSNPPRLVRAAALATIVAAAGLGTSFPAWAEEKAGQATPKIIIKRVGEDEKNIVINGKPFSELRAQCDGSKQEADVRSGEGKDQFRTRVVLCGEKAANSAEGREKLVQALERAKDGLREHDMLSDKARAHAEQALEREIERLRSGSR